MYYKLLTIHLRCVIHNKSLCNRNQIPLFSVNGQMKYPMNTILFVNFVFYFITEANPLVKASYKCLVKGKTSWQSWWVFVLSIVHKKLSRHCWKPTTCISCLVNIIASFIWHVSLSILEQSDMKMNRHIYEQNCLKKILFLTLNMIICLSKYDSSHPWK